MENVIAQPKRGRPRQFDREKALDAAMRLFWEKGFAGTSVNELLTAMNINAPSLYAAFGDKRALFEASVDHYQAGCGSFAVRALLEEPTARQSIERMLREAVKTFSDPALPPGCMVVCSAINYADNGEPVHQFLLQRRKLSERMVRKRIERGVSEGDVPSSCEVGTLTSFILTIFQGLSLQARDGASRRSMDAVVTRCMEAWPR